LVWILALVHTGCAVTRKGDFSSLRREQVEEGDVVESTGEDWLYMERAFLRQTSCPEPCLLAFA
jgi:hypothetical protein